MSVQLINTCADTPEIGVMINQLKSLAALHGWTLRKCLPKPLDKYRVVAFLVKKDNKLMCINVNWQTGRLQLLTGLPESQEPFRKWVNKRWPAVLRHGSRMLVDDPRYHVPPQSRFR